MGQGYSNKILITIPFWSQDREQAGYLARLLADLEPGHSSLADILFVARFDAKHDPETVKYASRKFNCYTHTSARQETGWPHGCNGIFFGSLEFIYHKMEAKQIPHYKAFLMCEADTVPLRKHWLSWLHGEWAKRSSSCISGALISHPEHPHINGGCCLITGELKFLKWLTKIASGIHVKAGWDWYLADEFYRRGWSDIPGIRSLWNTPTFTKEEIENLREEGAVLLHGCKDLSALTYARELLI